MERCAVWTLCIILLGGCASDASPDESAASATPEPASTAAVDDRADSGPADAGEEAGGDTGTDEEAGGDTDAGTGAEGDGATDGGEAGTDEDAGTERIEFASGATSTTVAGTTRQADPVEYIAEARQGQTAHIRVTSAGSVANFTLVAPDGSPLKRAPNGGPEVTLDLTATGDYRIEVTAPGDAGEVDYQMLLEIE